MDFKMYSLAPLIKDMRKHNKDMESFGVTYANTIFDIIIDISNNPFEMLIGAKSINYACVLEINKGYTITMSDDDFYRLCDSLHLKPSKDSLTSFKFLKYISDRVPISVSTKTVRPSQLMPFRRKKIRKEDEVDKTIFWGWNDHTKDGKTARNFNKTELFFGKRVADFCRKNNISSMWKSPADGVNEKDPIMPPNYVS